MEYVNNPSVNYRSYISIVESGTAVVTSAGKLPSKHIIHVVSPIWTGGDNGEEAKLALCVVNA